MTRGSLGGLALASVYAARATAGEGAGLTGPLTPAGVRGGGLEVLSPRQPRAHFGANRLALREDGPGGFPCQRPEPGGPRGARGNPEGGNRERKRQVQGLRSQ
eukprot:11224378-Lingulodinium_polyedra.AAC.1